MRSLLSVQLVHGNLWFNPPRAYVGCDTCLEKEIMRPLLQAELVGPERETALGVQYYGVGGI